MKVLSLRRAITEEAGERTGIFTSGVVSTAEGRKIALFFTGRQHAGENLADVLKRRAAELPMPIQMSDALSRNAPKPIKLLVGNYLAHGKRQFVHITPNFPEQCRHVLEALGEVYDQDRLARERGLSRLERLHFHQQHSRPVMDDLHQWFDTQLKENKVEPNSGFRQSHRLYAAALASADPVSARARRPTRQQSGGTRSEESDSAPKELTFL
jgi:transposase